MMPKYLKEEMLKNVNTGNTVIVLDQAYREDLDMYEYFVLEEGFKNIILENSLRRIK